MTPDTNETARLERLYEQLRERLLDMSLRNPMLNYRHQAASKRHIRMVDASLEDVHDVLTNGAELEIAPLPEPDESLRDERTPKFLAALDHARVADAGYLAQVRALESAGADDEAELAEAERALKDRLRARLGLPPRPDRKTVDPLDHARELGVDPSFELRPGSSGRSPAARKLQTLKWPDALDAVLGRIADDARLAEQETGLSTLFLVLGFLEWREKEDSAKKFLAPLLLLPVRLEKRRSRGRTLHMLMATAEVAEINLSLQKKLERDFGRRLPELEGDEEHAESVESYLARAADAVEGLRGWTVRRFLTLGHFAFGRFAMYADLAAGGWETNPLANSLVASIVSGSERGGDAGGSSFNPPEDYHIDDPEVERCAPLLVHDADASQHSALVDVMQNRHLVIQGPPGTGKSQTITNIIANALAAGRTVLFLAEKQAALDVVKRRLDTAGLGEFCLELHSDKAEPRLVVEGLRRRCGLAAGQGTGRTSRPTDKTWEESRQEIGRYVAALHAGMSGGQTPFDLIWRALRARSEMGPVLEQFDAVALPQDSLDDEETRQDVAGVISVYARMAEDFAKHHGPFIGSPWRAIGFSDLNAVKPQGLLTLLAELARRAGTLADFATEAGLEGEENLDAFIALDLGLPQGPTDGALVAKLAGLNRDEVERLVGLCASLRGLDAKAAAAPLPAPAPEETRALVSQVMASIGATPLAALTPAALHEEMLRQIELASRVLAALQALARAAHIIGAPDDFSCSGAAALVEAAAAAGRLTSETRPWFLWRPRGGAALFDRARSDWTQLVAAEARWRKRFPHHGIAVWPAPDLLARSAAMAARSPLGRILGAGRGERKIFAQIKERLGLTPTDQVSADELRELADHAQAVSAFLNTSSYQQMLGSAWSGLDTPFDLIGEALTFSEEARAAIARWPHGNEVVERLSELDDRGLVQLAAAGRALGTIQTLGEEVWRRLDGFPVNAKIAEVARFKEHVESIAALDLKRRFAALSCSLSALHEGLQAAAARQRASAQLSSHPFAAEAEALAGSEEAIGRTRDALAWIDAIRQRQTPARIREALLSGDAVRMRDRIASIAREAARALEILGDIERSHGVTGFGRGGPGAVGALAARLLAGRDHLTEYLSLCSQRDDLARRGVGPLIEKADTLDVEADDLRNLFDGLVARRRAQIVRDADPVLSRISGLRIEARRREFIERDRRKIDADRLRVREALLALQPPPGGRSGPRKTWTDMELLRNEFGKEKRFLPVRRLMQRAGGAIQKLKPCFMMSPLSLAKFLPAGGLRFDLLVIDEASQMRPEDALGGLLRARQLVVVGDQKQLPPTDFFSRFSAEDRPATEEEEDFEDIDDESILEACQKTFRQTRLLRWHYRSRCESLIAFSNREFYKGCLITFPMARPGSFSVDLIRVDGYSEAGCNPIEARVVAREAVQFMRRFADAALETLPSLGVVAVNIRQRDLILEELRRFEADDERVERYRAKAADKGEPVFVKNLENVQGDERDFIFISMTYGPKPGMAAFAQRFGPINGKQGHRRLNVLFSRARDRIGLFASFGSADVKPGATSAEGVHVLKRYLEYAESRGREPGRFTGLSPDSDFEVEVAERLRSRGYIVDYQVGVSGYRIDLGVRHPDYPERYLAGVECDGARYHSSKSARDRDRLREEVLNGLGWDIIRVWSTDWFDNAESQTERLIRRLEEVRTRPVPAHEGWRFGQPCADDQNATEQTVSPEMNGAGTEERTQDETPPPAAPVSEETEAPDRDGGGAAAPGDDPTPAGAYIGADVAASGAIPDPQRFYDPAYQAELARMASHVISVEGPIYLDVLVSRIAKAHGFQRRGATIVETITQAVAEDFPRTQEEERILLWPAGAAPCAIVPFRPNGGEARELTDVPLVELASLAGPLLAGDTDDERILAHMRERLDLGRLREGARQRFEAAIRLARAAAGRVEIP